MLVTPSDASTAKYTSTIGPKSAPTRATPRDWIKNRAIRMATAIGRTSGRKLDWTTVSPSTAESTETAGVIIASP